LVLWDYGWGSNLKNIVSAEIMASKRIEDSHSTTNEIRDRGLIGDNVEAKDRYLGLCSYEGFKNILYLF